MGLLCPVRAFMLGLALSGAALSGRAQNITSAPADRPSPAQLAALRDGGIPAAARVTGSFVYTLGRPGYLISGPIRVLTDSSTDVFVGVVSETRAHLSGNGESIVTDYDVDVEEALKGSAREHARVVVEIEGGRVTFADGTWAEVRLTNEERTDGTFELFTPPRVGERFAFFCSRTPPTLRERAAGAAPGVFYLSYGVFGLYELTRDGIVNPRGPNRDISARYRGQPSDAFLREMRASLPQITGKFTVTVDPHARVGMPLWVHADIDKELLAYPYSSDPRDLDTDSCNHLELKRNGEVLTEQAPQVVVRGSPRCGSSFFPGAPRNRLPLHLAFKIDQPGHYSVRWTMMRPDPTAWTGQQSDWVDFDVVEASPAEREAWLTKLLGAPPSTLGKFAGDYWPSLLAASSDSRVAQALVDGLESPDFAASYARGSLYLCPAEILAPLLRKTLQERGPTEALADAILWRPYLFQDVRDDITRAAGRSLASDDDRRVSGALRILGGLDAFDWRGDSSVMREASQTIERAAPALLNRSQAVARETVILLGSIVRTDAARDLLWHAVDQRPDVREQAAIALGWIHDPRDLPRLSGVLSHPPNGGSPVDARRIAASNAGVQLRSTIASERIEGANALIDMCLRSRSFGLDCADAVSGVLGRQIGSGLDDVSEESWRDAALIAGRFQIGGPWGLLVRLEREGAADALITWGEPVVLPAAEVLKVAGPARRRLAAFVLGAIGNNDAADALRATLRSDSDPSVNEAIQRALDHLGERPPRAVIR